MADQEDIEGSEALPDDSSMPSSSSRNDRKGKKRSIIILNTDPENESGHRNSGAYKQINDTDESKNKDIDEESDEDDEKVREAFNPADGSPTTTTDNINKSHGKLSLFLDSRKPSHTDTYSQVKSHNQSPTTLHPSPTILHPSPAILHPSPTTLRPIPANQIPPSPTPGFQLKPSYIMIAATVVAVLIRYVLLSDPNSKLSTNSNDWRSTVDPNNNLSEDQRSLVRASLKSLFGKPSIQEDVSTLLILSPHEETAAKLGRCLLGLVNSVTHKDQLNTEIDLRTHRGGKLQLDSDLKTLLHPGDTIRAVLLRHIDNNLTGDAFERARLLFAYCDGENPVIPHRLIIMTATSNNENELRETFKSYWPTQHDFVSALMSRISGHTLYVDDGQKSIC